MEQFEPILRFVCFLIGDIHFRIKIRLTLSMSRFLCICTDTCTATQHLLRKDIFLFCFA